MIDEITSSKKDGLGLIDEIPKYSHYLCFTVSVRTNKFALKQLDRYSPEQEEVFQKIKSLHESGLGYRKIAHHLIEKGLLLTREKSGVRWKLDRRRKYDVNNVHNKLFSKNINFSNF